MNINPHWVTLIKPFVMWSNHNPSYLPVTPDKSRCELQWPLLKYFTGPEKHYLPWAVLVGHRGYKAKHSYSTVTKEASHFLSPLPTQQNQNHHLTFWVLICRLQTFIQIFYICQGMFQYPSDTRSRCWDNCEEQGFARHVLCKQRNKQKMYMKVKKYFVYSFLFHFNY